MTDVNMSNVDVGQSAPVATDNTHATDAPHAHAEPHAGVQPPASGDATFLRDMFPADMPNDVTAPMAQTTQTTDIPPVIAPPVKVAWPASKTLSLPEFQLEIPNKLGGGLLAVYRTPALGDMGGYRYEAFYNQSEVEQRPGCAAEDMIELIRIRVSAGYGINDPNAPRELTQVVEYKHAGIDYIVPVTGDVTAPEGV